ncbi:hypothetical protein KKA95_01715 [Patescibacteria group bacterium]|nr:hypothetical protein [Patescibacteria group bacterium]
MQAIDLGTSEVTSESDYCSGIIDQFEAVATKIGQHNNMVELSGAEIECFGNILLAVNLGGVYIERFSQEQIVHLATVINRIPVYFSLCSSDGKPLKNRFDLMKDVLLARHRVIGLLN